MTESHLLLAWTKQRENKGGKLELVIKSSTLRVNIDLKVSV